MADSLSPYQVAQHLLTAAVQVLDDNDRDIPAVQFVAPGEPAFTTPVLCVRVLQSMPGMIGRPDFTVQTACLTMRTLDLEVWLTRCVPTIDDSGQVPSASALSAAAELVLDDAEALTAGMQAHAGQNTDIGLALTVGAWRLYGPNGGIAGVIQPVTVQLG